MKKEQKIRALKEKLKQAEEKNKDSKEETSIMYLKREIEVLER